MKGRVLIQNLVDNKMEELIPGWNELTPTDPLKVFTEGMICSLTEIDRQNKMAMDSMLELVPGLLSFQPKQPSLMKGLFHFEVKEHNKKELTIPKGLKLKYKTGGGKTNHILFDEQKLAPCNLISQDVTPEKIILSFQVFGKMEKIPLFFIRKENKYKNTQLQEVKVKLNLPESEHFFDNNSLLIQDSTQGLSKTGQINLTPMNFDFPEQQYTITVEIINNEKTNTGVFHTNLAVGNVCQIVPENILGHLDGEIWENISLPNNLLNPPAKISVEFPTGESVALKLAKNEILKMKEYQTDAYTHSYLYNTIQHTLTVPNAEIILQNKLSGAEVKAKNVIFTVETNQFPDAQAKIILEGLEETVKKVTPIVIMSPVVERESKEQYLDRFYKTLNQFYTFATKNITTYSPAEIKTNILNFDSNVRAIELNEDAENELLQIFILSFNPYLYPEQQLDQKLITKIQNHAEELINIDRHVLVSPFVQKKIAIDISLKVRLTNQDQYNIDKSNLETEVQKTCADFIMPWPFGQLKAHIPLNLNELKDKLKSSLSINENDIEEFSMTLLDCETLVHLDQLKRKDGECLIPQLNLNVEFNDAVAKDENIILSSSSIDILDDDEVFDVFK